MRGQVTFNGLHTGAESALFVQKRYKHGLVQSKASRRC